jgi:hypothetical protein
VSSANDGDEGARKVRPKDSEPVDRDLLSQTEPALVAAETAGHPASVASVALVASQQKQAPSASNGDGPHVQTDPATWPPTPEPRPGGSQWADVRCYGCGRLKPLHRTDYEAGRFGECFTCRHAFEPIDPDREPAGALL